MVVEGGKAIVQLSWSLSERITSKEWERYFDNVKLPFAPLPWLLWL